MEASVLPTRPAKMQVIMADVVLVGPAGDPQLLPTAEEPSILCPFRDQRWNQGKHI